MEPYGFCRYEIVSRRIFWKLRGIRMSERKKVVICSVGDLMLSDSPLFVGVGVGSTFPSIKDDLFKSCGDHFKNADVVIGNFETVVYHPKHKNLAEMQMACPESTIQVVRDAGFSILNLANNHCLQHGTDNFFHTKKVCEDTGMGVIGIRDENPYVVDIEGNCIAFFSLCIHIEWYQPDDIHYEDNIERVLKKVKEFHKAEPDAVLVLAVHWGDEYATFPSNAQIKLAHYFVECGIDIILGHHSHVFQGIEKYGDSLIVYSQGNFISDMISQICRETGIVKISIEVNDHKKSISYEIIPYYISDSYIPVFIDGNWFNERQDKLKRAFNNEFSDSDYWNEIGANRKSGRMDFRNKFIKSFFRYRLCISLPMLYEFIIRKVKKMSGKSKDGIKGSMDSEILAILNKEKII